MRWRGWLVGWRVGVLVVTDQVSDVSVACPGSG
jgi:hypothetical protein